MPKNHSTILSDIACTLLGVGLLLLVWSQQETFAERIQRQHDENRRYAAKIIPQLTHDKSIVGEWKGIRDSGVLGYSRIFAAPDEMQVCYGCFIKVGHYKIVDKNTIETRDSRGEIRRWLYGFRDNELIMIYRGEHDTCWVQEYERVPVGTLGYASWE